MKDDQDIPNNDKIAWQDFIDNPSQYDNQEISQEDLSTDYILSIDLHVLNCTEAYDKIVRAITYASNKRSNLCQLLLG